MWHLLSCPHGLGIGHFIFDFLAIALPVISIAGFRLHRKKARYEEKRIDRTAIDDSR